MNREEILKILSTYDLTEEEREYLYLQLYFTEKLNGQADEQILEFHKQQKENRDSILTEIAKIMLSYPIVDSIMSIGSSDKLELKNRLNILIQNKIQSEVNAETLKTKELLKSTGKNKYDINNYINDIGTKDNSNINPVEDETLDKIINDKVENKTWSDRLWDNKNDLQKDLKSEIDNFLNGKTTVNEIEDRIKKKFNSDAYETKRLVQDNVARVQEGVNEQWRQDHNVKWVLYMATLCHNTCGKCSQYDGKDYPANKKPVDLPQHPFCRCTYVNLPSKDWRPSQRLDNVTKEKVNWQTYEEWYKENKKPLVMDLQLFGTDNWKLLQEKIEKGIIDNDKFEMCYNEFNKTFKDGIKTPLENTKCNENTFVHIAQRHPDMIEVSEINNINKTLTNPKSIYEIKDKNGFVAKGYVSEINGNILLVIVRDDIITSYYPSENYLRKNILGGNVLWENK